MVDTTCTMSMHSQDRAQLAKNHLKTKLNIYFFFKSRFKNVIALIVHGSPAPSQVRDCDAVNQRSRSLLADAVEENEVLEFRILELEENNQQVAPPCLASSHSSCRHRP